MVFILEKREWPLFKLDLDEMQAELFTWNHFKRVLLMIPPLLVRVEEKSF